jgi:phage replication initiation protein
VFSGSSNFSGSPAAEISSQDRLGCVAGARSIPEHQPDEPGGGATEPQAGAPAPESRLVIRDERKTENKSLVSDESPVTEFDKDYESEIYTLESLGRRGVIIAHPVSLDSANPKLAHIDWHAFTVRPPQFKTHLWIMSELTRLFGFDIFTPRKTGLYGYKESAIIEEGGLIAWGGQNQRGTVYVSLNGQGCSRITDWQKMRTWCECHGARITRVDIAHDDFEGETVTIEKAKEWYDAGGFNSGGRKPTARLAGDWWAGIKGRTVYLGERASGKLTRIYEKGKEQGNPESPWVRVELELHNKSRVIPLDALTRPAAYLAGAYPCLRFLSAEQCKVKTTTKAAKTAYDKSVRVARLQYGKLVNLMLKVHQGDYAGVVNALKREGIPARLDPFSYHLRTDPALIDALDGRGLEDVALVT